MTAAEDDYARGVIAGEINARLAQHDKHFADLNGSVDRMERGVADLVLKFSKMADGMTSRDEKAIATALALKEAEDRRRAQADQKWSVWQKVFASLSGFAAVGTCVAVILTLLHH
jgi:anti-sigma-K factor RskA